MNKGHENNPETEFGKNSPEQEEKEKNGVNQPKEDKAADNKEGQEAKKDEDKKKYNLEDVVEYAELKTEYEKLQRDYDTLQQNYNALEQDKTNLDVENSALKEFKMQAERKDKQALIDSFYMLTDEDKQDAVEHIDTYSLEDIEAKLSVICVRNKVDFNLNKATEVEQEDKPNGMFNLEGFENTASVPAWVKAVLQNAR